MAGAAQGLLDNLLGLVSDVGGARVRIGVKTNYGPEIDVGAAELGASSSSGSGAGQGVSGLLGLKAAVILRRENGSVLAVFGDPPATEGWRLVLLAGVALALSVLVVRGLRGL